MTKAYPWLIKHLLPGIPYHQHVYADALNGAIGSRVCWLDVGAGTRVHGGWLGVSSGDLAAKSEFFVGCDPEWSHLRKNSAVHARVASFGQALPFRKESFDLVTANMVLEHLPDPLPVFQEIARVLKDGGLFVFVTPNRLHPAVAIMSLLNPDGRRIWAKRLESHRNAAHIFPTYYRANSAEDLASLANNAGLAPVRLEVFRSWPMNRHFAPAIALECLWIRFSGNGPLRRLASNIVGVLRKT